MRMVNSTFRKGIRRGLGLKQWDSIRDRLGDAFVEATVRTAKLKDEYLHRAFKSQNELVAGLARSIKRRQYS